MRSTDFFRINDHGIWSGPITIQHAHDPRLAQQLVTFFKSKDVKSVLDLGAGPGLYSETLSKNGILASCYDGNPDTQTLSKGKCAIADLTFDLNFSKHDWVLSLEVGEHLPKEYEDIFFGNIIRNSKHGIVLSWAVPGQGGDGHVNLQSNNYVKSKMASLGYFNNIEAENIFREASTLSWFKNTIMVFEPLKEEIELIGEV